MTAPAIQQRTPAWHELRRVSIGSSDIPVIAGLSPYKSEYELAVEKLGLLPEPERPVVDPLLVGTLMEPVILELYRRQSKRKAHAEHGVRVHPELPWAIASLDAVTFNERPIRIVELKHSYSGIWRGHTLPDSVEVQVMWQMGVAGYARADVCGLIYGMPVIYELDFDPGYFADLVRLAERFRSRLEEGTFPDPTGSEGDRRALAARYPTDDGTWLRPTDEMVSLALDIRDAERQAKDADNHEATLKNAMRALLGEASGVGSIKIDGWQISWKQGRDRTVVDYRSIVEELESSDPTVEPVRLRHTSTKPGNRSLLTRFDLAEEGVAP